MAKMRWFEVVRDHSKTTGNSAIRWSAYEFH